MKTSTISLVISLCLMGVFSSMVSSQTETDKLALAQMQFLYSAYDGKLPQTEANLGFTALPLKDMFSALASPTIPIRLSKGGFGDPQNSYAWSIGVYKGDLYIGTGRLVDTFHPMWEAIWTALNSDNPNFDPSKDIPHLPDEGGGANIPWMKEWLTGITVKDIDKFNQWNAGSQAQIWRYSAKTHRWTNVFTAPMVPSFLNDGDPKDAGNPQQIQVAASMGFRKMDVYTDMTGASAIFTYTGGIAPFAPQAVAPLIYKSTDGTAWTGISTPLGMGRQTRASCGYNGRLYVGTDPVSGVNGASVWYTETISPTADDWIPLTDFGKLDPYNSGIISIASFNDKLYVGTQNSKGFQVWCTANLTNPTMSDWDNVIRDGGVDHYNAWAATMHVFNDQLYVGSIGLPFLGSSSNMKGFDIYRISENNEWELLVGGGQAASPVAGYENVKSRSGWSSGFGNPMNFYCWSMEEYNGKLYVGSFDASVFLRYLKDYTGSLPPDIKQFAKLAPFLATGADLWSTTDGVRWTPRSLNGLGNQNNYGLRTMTVFNGNLVVGTSNPFQGCEVLSLWQLGW